MAKHNQIGELGEDLACKWLKEKGFSIVERNYSEKWGEIDVVARLPAGQAGETARKLHFIEVKTVSHETKNDLEQAVSHGTWRPEENVHKNKQERLGRAIQTWILKEKYEGEWQIDVLALRIVPREKYCSIKFIENVVFE